MMLEACSVTPSPMKYLAADLPNHIITTGQNSEYIEINDHKFGFLYRKPQDVGSMVRKLHKKTNAVVLKNADVRIRIPFCLYFLCYAYDTASAGLH